MDCVERTKEFYKAELENCKRLYKQMAESLNASRLKNIELCEQIGKQHEELVRLKKGLTSPISDLDHPCRQTCSGWQQGYERGYLKGSSEQEEKIKRLRARIDNVGELIECGADYDTVYAKIISPI